MDDLKSLETLYDHSTGDELPLPSRLRQLYGQLRFPLQAGNAPRDGKAPRTGRAHVFTNFVSSLDGVVTLNVPGHEGGGDISGFNPQDRMVMGILRSAADAVLITSHSLGVEPRALWTGPSIFPGLAGEYQSFRQALGRPAGALHVVVTASGKLDPAARLLSGGEMPVLVVTTEAGQQSVTRLGLPKNVHIVAAGADEHIAPERILSCINDEIQAGLVLVEGGPHLAGDFFGDGLLDELFLTEFPQVAGRTDAMQRLGFVAGRVLAPEQPTWGELVSVKKSENHLFLRYSFANVKKPALPDKT